MSQVSKWLNSVAESVYHLNIKPKPWLYVFLWKTQQTYQNNVTNFIYKYEIWKIWKYEKK